MSLASLLLGLESSTSDVSRSAKVDDELDAMFRSDVSQQSKFPVRLYQPEIISFIPAKANCRPSSHRSTSHSTFQCLAA